MTGVGVGASPVFGGGYKKPTPITILAGAGLTGWWDAAQEITLNGSTVSAWGDAASTDANRTFSQGTAADQLTFVASGTPNGKPSLKFVDSTETMSTVSGPGTFFTVSAHTIWFVFKSPSALTSTPLIFGDPNARLALQMNATGFALNPLNYDTNYDYTTHSISTSTWYVLEWRHESGTLYSTLNGGTEQSAASGNVGGWGTSLRIRPTITGALNNAEIAEIITCNTAVALATRQRMTAWLRAKHGI